MNTANTMISTNNTIIIKENRIKFLHLISECVKIIKNRLRNWRTVWYDNLIKNNYMLNIEVRLMRSTISLTISQVLLIKIIVIFCVFLVKVT